MSENAAPDPLATPAASCANCGARLHGSFCAACGQPVRLLDPPIGHFAKEFAKEFLDVDNRVLRSLRRLFFSPGFLTREHVEGRRAPWISPLRLYLVTSVACFTVLVLVGDSGGVSFSVGGDPAATGRRLQRLGYASVDELRAAVDAARATWMPRVMFILVPLVAWLVARVRRTSGRGYPAHFVFTLHLYAAGFGVRTVTVAATAATPMWVGQGLAVLSAIYVVAYMYLAFRCAYGLTAAQAVRDTAIVAIGSWAALMLGTAAVVVAAIWGPSWLAGIGR